MSKLASMIKATQTGAVRASDTPSFRYADAEIHVQTVQGYDTEKQVRLNVKFSKDVFLSDHMAKDPDGIWDAALSAQRRAMIEEIFGEFRPILIEAQSAVYEKDFNRVRALLIELENQMFVDGL